MPIADFRLTRFQFARDRIIGDSQVRIAHAHLAAIELLAENGEVGLGFMQSLFHPLPALTELERVFREEVWGTLEGEQPAAIVNRVRRPRGGNHRRASLPFEEGVNQAAWDLAARQAGLPLWRMLGGHEGRVRAYASGLDFHLSDEHFSALFADAAELGYGGFKIKVGHPEVERDLHRLRLLRKVVGDVGPIMIDANEAWSPKEAIRRLKIFRGEGFAPLWVEDPCRRDDFAGLREIRAAAPWTHVNSGEYLDLSGKRRLLEARGADMLNIHGHVTDAMRAGWLAAEHDVPVTVGNTTLEIGIHVAAALPEVAWIEYSFLNYDHLVEQPIEIRDGHAFAPERPGHGLTLAARARTDHACPEILDPADLPPAPSMTRPAFDAR